MYVRNINILMQITIGKNKISAGPVLAEREINSGNLKCFIKIMGPQIFFGEGAHQPFLYKSLLRTYMLTVK
jgi:hypothetical protein